jgi:hypothetical protein
VHYPKTHWGRNHTLSLTPMCLGVVHLLCTSSAWIILKKKKKNIHSPFLVTKQYFSYFSLNGEIYKLLGVFQVIHKRKFLISIELSFRCIMPLIIENKCHENQNQKLALKLASPSIIKNNDRNDH